MLHLIYNNLKELFISTPLLELDNVDKDKLRYGKQIKTLASYRKNIDKLISIAKSKDEQLLLISYASYFPESVTLTGKESDRRYFSQCTYASPISIWGDPEDVRKSIDLHNRELEELALARKVYYLDMKSQIPADSKYFCDVCHFSEDGSRLYTSIVSDFILKNHLLDLEKNNGTFVHAAPAAL